MKKLVNLTYPQKAILLTEQFYKNTAVNNICGTAIIDSVLDFDALNQAINTVVKENDVFRLVLTKKSGEIKQFKTEYKETNFEIIDIKDKSEVCKIEDALMKKAFNLLESDLYEFKMFRFENGCGGFLLNVHHIISDGWTLGLVCRKIMKAYSNIKTNEVSDENIEYSYLDYAESESEYKNSTKFLKDKTYWEELFSGNINPAILPSDNQEKSAELSCLGERLSFSISKAKMKLINEYCVKNKITVFNFFMAIYSIYISKIINSTDFSIGTPILNRTNFKEKNIAGMFVNVVPFRVQINPELEFVEFVQSIAEETIGLLRHQKYPYQLLLEELRKKDSSIPNLYNIVLSYQITKANNETEYKYSTRWAFNKHATDDISIQFLDLDEEGSLTVSYDFKKLKYSEDYIKSMNARIFEMINKILETDSIIIKDIEIITNEEKNKILNNFNATSLSYPKTKTIIGLIEEQSMKNGDNIALKYKESSLTYNELNEKANRLANYLISRGVKKQDVVGVCLDKDINLIISILAILKIGAIYMPMFNEYPTERINYLLENSNAKLIITNNNISKVINVQVDICLINNLNLNNYENNLKLPEKLSAEDIIYIIYTSGSTGNPKGVKISNLCLNNFVHSFGNLFKVNTSDVFLSSTNISFDVSIFEIFLPFVNGATLVLHTENIIKNIFEFCNNIIYNSITALYIPPNILNEVYGLLKDNPNCKISKLLVGVEPIRKNVLNQYYNLNKDMIIVNGYGPTETTICATALKYKKDLSNNGIVSIGRPVHNNEIYILDNCKNVVPIGIVGEIYVSGDGVGLGYLNNEIETSKNYITQVINGNTKRLYKTGDLAKWNNDGTITFVGRKDRQIKFSGYRIEFSEIEYTMLKYPGVKKAYILPYEKNKNLNLVAYFLADSDVSVSDLSTFLRSKLAFYMIPKAFIQLEEFPTNNNGKIDNSKLPIPNFKVHQEYVAPQNDTEKILCDIIKKLFSISRVGINDNFFDLGGDSLLAIKLQIEALNKGVYLEYEDIFSYPVIKDLANREKKKSKYNVDEEFDYSHIDNLLQNAPTGANIESVNVNNNNLNNILLIGATGFLGSHILNTYLSSTNGIAYCLVRENTNSSPEDKLKKILNFYFEDKYDSYFGSRIQVISGDITLKDLGLSGFNPNEKNISCIINSAAFVKHYGDFDKFKATNITGVQNITKFCKNFNLKLYHISTTSVSGFGLHENLLGAGAEQKNFDETNFYIGQNLNNAYVYTKFEAEKIILNDIAKNKLNACILRVGSITNRYSDGHFQFNLTENAFVNRVKSILSIGMIPDYLAAHSVEFTPVDSLASAIIKVALNDCNLPVLHLCNPNLIKIPILLKYINQLGFSMKLCTNDEFVAKINEYLKDKNLKNQISGIINDLDKNKSINLVSSIIINSDFSKNYLEKIGFKWPEITEDYIQKFIEYFKINGYF